MSYIWTEFAVTQNLIRPITERFYHLISPWFCFQFLKEFVFWVSTKIWHNYCQRSVRLLTLENVKYRTVLQNPIKTIWTDCSTFYVLLEEHVSLWCVVTARLMLLFHLSQRYYTPSYTIYFFKCSLNKEELKYFLI